MGLILEVDLEYRQALHDQHNDYPVAAEKIKVNKDMLSNYCETIRQKYGITIGQVQKLIPTKKNMSCITETYNCIWVLV